jgi:hypothetical protein
MKKLRILIGTIETGGLIADYAEGFRELGHDVTTVVAWPYAYCPHLTYDYDISPTAPDIIPWSASIAGSQSPLIRFPRGAMNRAARLSRLASLITQHDVFFFKWAGVSLTPGNREFPLLKALGKRVISAFMGSDVRDMTAYEQQYDELSRTPAFKRVLNGRANEAITNPYGPMRNLRMAELYSDVVLSQPNQSGLAVRPYRHLFLAIPLKNYRYDVPGREVPVVVHAPSQRDVKGTERILAALDRLKSEGVRFELRLLQGLTTLQVLDELTAADVLVDQLYFPYHGKLTLEGMASGCAVATCNREDYEPFPAGRPICHIDSARIDDQLRPLLTDRNERVRLAAAGRRHVEHHHDHVKVANRMLQYLDADNRVTVEHYPAFFAREYRTPNNQPLSREAQRLTWQVIRRWGLPDGATVDSMVERGLLPAHARDSLRIVRWGPPHGGYRQSRGDHATALSSRFASRPASARRS